MHNELHLQSPHFITSLEYHFIFFIQNTYIQVSLKNSKLLCHYSTCTTQSYNYFNFQSIAFHSHKSNQHKDIQDIQLLSLNNTHSDFWWHSLHHPAYESFLQPPHTKPSLNQPSFPLTLLAHSLSHIITATYYNTNYKSSFINNPDQKLPPTDMAQQNCFYDNNYLTIINKEAY